MAVLDVSSYEPQEHDKFFFDTNIWISIFEPLGNKNQIAQDKYSSFFDKIVSSKSKVYISSLIISEFINTILRLDFNFWKREEGNRELNFKKDYRNSSRCKEKSKVICKTLEDGILAHSICVNDDFKKIGIKSMLKNLENSDFNDLYIAQLAKIKKYKIVTDDRDFFDSSDVPIFSCI